MADDPKFDPNKMTVKELKKAPIAVVKTEFPALAKALGLEPGALFRSLSGGASAAPGDEGNTCCNSDSW